MSPEFIREGIDLGLIRDDDPTLMAYGVVGVVSTYSHFQRTGRLGATPKRSRASSDGSSCAASRPTTTSRDDPNGRPPQFPLLGDAGVACRPRHRPNDTN